MINLIWKALPTQIDGLNQVIEEIQWNQLNDYQLKLVDSQDTNSNLRTKLKTSLQTCNLKF